MAYADQLVLQNVVLARLECVLLVETGEGGLGVGEGVNDKEVGQKLSGGGVDVPAVCAELDDKHSVIRVMVRRTKWATRDPIELKINTKRDPTVARANPLGLVNTLVECSEVNGWRCPNAGLMTWRVVCCDLALDMFLVVFLDCAADVSLDWLSYSLSSTTFRSVTLTVTPTTDWSWHFARLLKMRMEDL